MFGGPIDFLHVVSSCHARLAPWGQDRSLPGTFSDISMSALHPPPASPRCKLQFLTPRALRVRTGLAPTKAGPCPTRPGLDGDSVAGGAAAQEAAGRVTPGRDLCDSCVKSCFADPCVRCVFTDLAGIQVIPRPTYPEVSAASVAASSDAWVAACDGPKVALFAYCVKG